MILPKKMANRPPYPTSRPVFAAVLWLLFFLNACRSSPDDRFAEARAIAERGPLAEREIRTALFSLTAFERLTAPAEPVDIYIEGDGLAWLGSTRPSSDPTPLDPVALRLAALDPAANVVYIARPCQYKGMNPSCSQAYWTRARFAPEVVAAMSAALDDLRSRGMKGKFNLVGFSGGGAIAALLAARRNDVASLRTVAGNLDTDLFTRVHGVSPLTGSLNPRDAAPSLAKLPQHHFVGKRDEIVPREITDSFVAGAGNTACIRVTNIPQATHEAGWVSLWPDLLKEPLDCASR
jgi:dienelactone hydrolase